MVPFIGLVWEGESLYEGRKKKPERACKKEAIHYRQSMFLFIPDEQIKSVVESSKALGLGVCLLPLKPVGPVLLT